MFNKACTGQKKSSSRRKSVETIVSLKERLRVFQNVCSTNDSKATQPKSKTTKDVSSSSEIEVPIEVHTNGRLTFKSNLREKKHEICMCFYKISVNEKKNAIISSIYSVFVRE